jgi:hypothetical protein
VPGQDGPDIEEDTMHPDITKGLVADRIREWRDLAARDRLLRKARGGRHTTTTSAADRLSPLVWFGRRADVAVANDDVAATDHRPSPDRRAA